MGGPRTHQRGRLLAVAVLAGALAAAPAPADTPLRLGALPVADGKPLRLAADEFFTWTEVNEQVILLRGKALIEQGILQVRAARAVLWVDVERHRKTGVYGIQAVAEGDVAIENGPSRQTSAVATFELSTKPDPAPQPGVRVIQQAQGTDAFFRRALEIRPPTTSGVQLTAGASPPPSTGAAVTPIPTQGTPPVEWPSQTPPPSAPNPAPSPVRPAPSGPLPTVPVPGTDAVVPVPPPDSSAPAGPPRMLTVAPRSAIPYSFKGFRTPSGEQVGIFSGGILLLVRNVQNIGLLDIEADRMVVWYRGNSDQLLDRMQSSSVQTDQQIELYLAGNVQIRRAFGKDQQQVLKAEQIYYDVHRNVAVAVQADLELRSPGVPEPLHMKADELTQVSPTRFEAIRAEVFSTKLPSDPGLKIVFAQASVEHTTIERRGLFGQPVIDRATGKPQSFSQNLVHGEQVFLKIENVPIFYLPVVQGDANDPLGPLQSIGFKQDRIFGTQVYTTFNVWNLLNRNPAPGTRWTLDADYLSERGPALGTNFDYSGKDLFGLSGPFVGTTKLYGIYDTGTDILGGDRGPADNHPLWRGRAFWQHSQKLFDDVTLQTQLSLLSDKNFLEQYYKQEFDTGADQQTFVYLKYQRDNVATSLLVMPNLIDWMTQTAWLPRVEGNILGKSFLDVFTYNLRSSAGYAQLRPTEVPPFPWPSLMFTDVKTDAARLDVNQELSLPFYLGPVKLVPYGVLDLTYYSDDNYGQSAGRLYGGGGVRASVPFSHLYPKVQSDLFNLNAINHKIVVSGNYFIANSTASFVNFPQFDQLNDNATDQALRDITPRQPFLNPANGTALSTSALYNPQLYAIRRLVDNSVDTLDTIEVIQADIRQRWQTKRGYPGQEHVVDYVTLDLSASFFPHPDRDNFGKSVAFLEYDATWNVGDRTALVSTGWVDPFVDGARVFTFGAFFNRPDRTSFYLGYRYVDPIDSRALTTAATYIFSPKYAITASSTYDFGINQALANSLVITRVGTDLTMSLGVNYNAILNNFGVTVEVLPNVVAANRRTTGQSGRNMLH